MSDAATEADNPRVTKVSYEVGKILRQMIKLASSLRVASDEEPQRALILGKEEARFIATTLITAADHLRMMQGHQSMIHPPQ
jgi:hypothetical protein